MAHAVCDFTHLWLQFVLSQANFRRDFCTLGDLYEVCSNFKHQEGKNRGNREKRKYSEICRDLS